MIGFVLIAVMSALLVGLSVFLVIKLVLGIRWAMSHEPGIGPRSGFLGSGFHPYTSSDLSGLSTSGPDRQPSTLEKTKSITEPQPSDAEEPRREIPSSLAAGLFAAKFASAALGSIGRKPSETNAVTSRPILMGPLASHASIAPAYDSEVPPPSWTPRTLAARQSQYSTSAEEASMVEAAPRHLTILQSGVRARRPTRTTTLIPPSDDADLEAPTASASGSRVDISRLSGAG